MSLKASYAKHDIDFPEAGEVWEWIGVGAATYLVLDNGYGDSLGYFFTALHHQYGSVRRMFWNYENMDRWRRIA